VDVPDGIGQAGPAAQAAAWLRGEVSLAALRGYTEEELASVAELGYALFRQGSLDLATTVFEGLAALTGREYPLRALAAIAVAGRRYADALPLLDAAIERSRSALAGRLLRAEALLHLGRYTDAQDDLDWIIRAAPRDADEEALCRRAIAMRRRRSRP
jgi:tetratricopeptide (TPR) repeat protein